MAAIMFLYYTRRAVLCLYNNGFIGLWPTCACIGHTCVLILLIIKCLLVTTFSLFQEHEKTVRAFRLRKMKLDHNYEVSLHNIV